VVKSAKVGSWPDVILIAKSIFTLGMYALNLKKSLVFDFATRVNSGAYRLLV
jgi:hypothetical protein